MKRDLIIDSHAHLNFQAFQDDLKEVVERSLNHNVWSINVGSQYETSKRAVAIAHEYDQGVYASVGLHPIHADKEEFEVEKYRNLAKKEKVVAIGETGLDYYYKPKNKAKKAEFKSRQKDIFLSHIKLAIELNLPLIFHCRMAHKEMIEILKEYKNKINGVIHCFTGTEEDLSEYLEMNLYIGFTGIIFKLELNKVIEKTPIDKILAETDCPYLNPLNKEERNEPIYVEKVIQEIARIKKISYEEARRATTNNAKKLFQI